MGNTQINNKKLLKPSSKLPNNIIWPYCQKQFTTKITYSKFNKHLKKCEEYLKNPIEKIIQRIKSMDEEIEKANYVS